MMCDNCGRPLDEDDDVADVEVDLTKNERYDEVWCRACVAQRITGAEL